MAVFFFGSLAASLAQNLVQLVIFRAITGVGGGGLILLGQLIVSDVVTLRERGKYQGILVRIASSILFAHGFTDFAKGCIRCVIERHRPTHRRCFCPKVDLVSQVDHDTNFHTSSNEDFYHMIKPSGDGSSA